MKLAQLGLPFILGLYPEFPEFSVPGVAILGLARVLVFVFLQRPR
jgi:hypothetical protein